MKITTVRRRAIKGAGNVLRTRCPVCEREVEMLTQAQAAGILELDDRTLAALIADGRVHAIQTVNGNLWICKDSLFSI